MEEWKLEPMRDLESPPMERYRSHWREGGLVESGLRLGWWSALKCLFGTWNRLRVHGREHLPPGPPFVLAANHQSHLDALVLGALLPLRWRDCLFPLAAKDVFFEKLPVASFAATTLNALPVWRHGAHGRALVDMRQRLLAEGCVYLLFPEGKRSRDGTMAPFKPGIGMLVAGTTVPVVPCYLHGTLGALRPGSWLVRPERITARLGKPLTFGPIANERQGWEEIATALEAAVRKLADGP